MMLARPSAEQERWLVALKRLPANCQPADLNQFTGGWQRASLVARSAFFVLGFIAALLVCALMWLLHLPLPNALGGVIALWIAETLIRQRRFGTGTEEALLLTGLILILSQAFITSRAFDESWLLIGLALCCLLAGIRLLNPLMVLSAALLTSFWITEWVKDGLMTMDNRSWSAVTPAWPTRYSAAALYCWVVAGVSLTMGARHFRRPCVDHLCNWLMVIMPIAGYAWCVGIQSSGLTWFALRAQPLMALPMLVMLSFAGIAIHLGLRRRQHAPLIAALQCLVCVGVELRDFTGMPLAWRLLLWGTLALSSALVLNRWLRTPRRGITSQPLRTSTVVDAMESVAITPLTPASPASSAGYQGHQGEFGGGGASGRF